MHGGHHRFDVEWLALAAGLKPAIRLAADALEASKIAEHFQRLGAAVASARGPASSGRHEHTLLYVARGPAEAAALRTAERPLLAAHLPPRDKAYYARELGLRLGYPRCCVDAFCDRVLRGPGRLRAGDRDAVHEDYVAARDAYVPRPDWRLNNLLLRQHLRLITFEPCRFDCAAALALPAALLPILERHQADALPGLCASLQRPLALAASGARAWLAPDGRAEPPREHPRAPADPADVRLAELLSAGLAPPGDHPLLRLEFSATLGGPHVPHP